MVVKHEIKSQLAKLLATEDLIVEHKNVDTAQFNVHTRVLLLPQWNNASNSVYDSLVSHEVGHALFTPDVEPPIHIPHQFINIVEDARVEKLMKRKYMGLAKTFYRGYNELFNNDFFEIDGKNLCDFNLADRINLYFKVGSWIDIFFSSTEEQIVDLVRNAETFDDTLFAAEALYNFCKQKEKRTSNKNKQEDEGYSEPDSEDSGTIDINSDIDNQSSISDSDSSSSVEDRGDSSSSTSRLDDSDPIIETAENLDRRLKNLIDNDMRENVYIEVPKINLEKIIIKNSEIHDQCKGEWKDQEELLGESSYIFYDADEDYIEFKRNAQKEVNYLVKEFECKKSASAYARASTAKTGVLDTSKLHTYKFNEDIFKKITVLPDGKNHGLVFILDWSGSMQHVLQDTLKQLYSLIWFCRKVNIPFEVYAFTQEYPIFTDDGIRHSVYDKREGVFYLSDTFSLMNFFTSKVNSRTLDEQMINIYRVAYGFKSYVQYTCPLGLRLSGTPLNETIIALHQILPKFRDENKLQKVQCVILTDGEAAQMTYHKEVRRHWESKPFLGCGYITQHAVLRDRKLGRTYSFSGIESWSGVTDQLILNLRDNFKDMNFIGIRILGSRDVSQFVRRYIGYNEEYETVMKKWRKEKSFSIKKSGYHTYFGLSSSVLDNDIEFEVQEDATKAQIKRAFVKSLKNKKMNKKVLSEFIELVA